MNTLNTFGSNPRIMLVVGLVVGLIIGMIVSGFLNKQSR